MQYVLTGFTPDKGFRVFAFQGIAADRARTDFTVRTDLALIQRYGIRMQDLPLLCLRLLERRDDDQHDIAITFTEDDMRNHATICAADREAAQAKKLTHRHPAPVSAGWRAPRQ